MEAIKERIKERALDVLDWIDYRPDPHWWPILAIPVVLVGGYFVIPMQMLPILLIATIGLTLVTLIAWAVGIGLCVAWRALRDVIEQMLRRRQRPSFDPRRLSGGLRA